MGLIESLNIELETRMPNFELKDPQGNHHHIDTEIGKKGLLIIFTCNHCPYAIAIWDRVIKLASEASKLGINTVAINPNINPDYPDDSAENMEKKCDELGLLFPYLVDQNQQVAKAYKAQCTPDLYVLNHEKKLVYHGRLDDNWKDENKVEKQELKDAIYALASNKEINKEQYPSMGCSIKWV